MNHNIEEKPAAEVLTSKKEYTAPSIREYGDVTNLVNAQAGTGSDGGSVNFNLS